MEGNKGKIFEEKENENNFPLQTLQKVTTFAS